MEALLEDWESEYGSKTISDIEALPDPQRAELINGYIYMMSTPTTAHQQISFEICAEIRNHIRAGNGKCRAFAAPCAVFLDSKQTRKNWVEPDIFVVCDPGKIHSDGIYGAPDWVIEIASPSSIGKDFVEKVFVYRKYGVKEYWIVNPMNCTVCVYNFEQESQFAQYSFETEITPSLYPGLSIRISDLLP